MSDDTKRSPRGERARAARQRKGGTSSSPSIDVQPSGFTYERCTTHLRVAPQDYLGHSDWMQAQHKKGLRQRQCQTCGLWLYYVEFGPGWKKAARDPHWSKKP